MIESVLNELRNIGVNLTGYTIECNPAEIPHIEVKGNIYYHDLERINKYFEERRKKEMGNFNLRGMEVYSNLWCRPMPKKENKLPEHYILNKDACICFWGKDTKTISKRHKDDEFDKELGFLFACWQYYNKDKSKNLRKKILSCIKYDCMKEFLFEKFRAENDMTVEQARKYLENLKVEEKKKAEKEIAKHMKEDN